jgi:hypothetical protein
MITGKREKELPLPIHLFGAKNCSVPINPEVFPAAYRHTEGANH